MGTLVRRLQSQRESITLVRIAASHQLTLRGSWRFSARIKKKVQCRNSVYSWFIADVTRSGKVEEPRNQHWSYVATYDLCSLGPLNKPNYVYSTYATVFPHLLNTPPYWIFQHIEYRSRPRTSFPAKNNQMLKVYSIRLTEYQNQWPCFPIMHGTVLS